MHPRAGFTWRDCPQSVAAAAPGWGGMSLPHKVTAEGHGSISSEGASVTPDSQHSQATEPTSANRGIWAATTCTPAGIMCSEDTVAVGPVTGESTALWVRKEKGPRPVATAGCEHRDSCHHYLSCACGERRSPFVGIPVS